MRTHRQCLHPNARGGDHYNVICLAGSLATRLAVAAGLVSALAFAMPGEAVAGGRVAMVLVAEDYTNLKKSEIGVKRGTEIADALRAKGLEVIFAANPSNAAARASLRDFSVKVPASELALVILIGHGTASGGQTFFLPVNTAIERATDLLSRGLSITNVGQIASHAVHGGVCFLMTTPVFPAPVDNVDPRPQFEAAPASNVAMAFSTSSKIPVSSSDSAAQQTASNLAALLQQPHVNLRKLIETCASFEKGAVFGVAADTEIEAPAAPPPAVAQPDPAQVEAARKLDAERAARQAAETKLQQEKDKVAEAEAAAQASKTSAARAEAEAKDAEERAKLAEADAKEQAAKAKAAAALAAAAPPAPVPAPQPEPARVAAVPDDLPTLKVLEGLLDLEKVREIQTKLTHMGLYDGPIDAIIGPLTRQAIKSFQKIEGVADTGYLTPEQLKLLTVGG